MANESVFSLIEEAVKGAKPADEVAPVTAAPAPKEEEVSAELPFPEDLVDTEPAAAEPEQLPDEPPKDHRKWAELKAKLKQYEQELKSAKEAPKEVPEDLKAEYEKRLAELEEKYNAKDEEVARLDLARSERFQREYVSKLDGILGRAAGLLKQHGNFDADSARNIVKAAFKKPFAERNRYLMDEAPELHAVLSTMLLQADDQRQVIEDAIAHHQATSAALDESEKHTKTVTTVKQVEDSLAKAVQDLAVEGNRYFRKSKAQSPEADAWNSNVDLRVQTARQVLLKSDPGELARYVAEGLSARALKTAYDRLEAELAKVKEENKSIAAQRPNVSNRPASASNVNSKDGMTVEQLIAESFASWKK